MSWRERLFLPALLCTLGLIMAAWWSPAPEPGASTQGGGRALDMQQIQRMQSEGTLSDHEGLYWKPAEKPGSP